MADRQAEKLGRRIGRLERSSSVVNLNQGGRDISPSFVFRSTEQVETVFSPVISKNFPDSSAIVFDTTTKGAMFDNENKRFDSKYESFEFVQEDYNGLFMEQDVFLMSKDGEVLLYD